MLDYIVGAVHVDEDLFVLELLVLIFSKIVDEGLLRSAKVTAEH